jgi:hypothetical protein
MATFPTAYCPSESSDIDTAEARDIWLKTGDHPLLRCSDEDCRREHPATRLSAVCCDPENPCEGKIPHFRTYPGHRHSDTCRFSEFAKYTGDALARKNELRETMETLNIPARNILLDIEGIDTSLLPDEYILEFSPRDFVHEVKKEAEKRIRNGEKRDRAHQLARCSVPQKTGKLADVVAMGFALDEKQARGRVPLLLPGRKNAATYANAFFSVYALRQHFQTPYIFCGDARVFTSDYGFFIHYRWQTRGYCEKFPELQIVTPIKEEFHRKSLLNELREIAAAGGICHVYSFSAHCLKEWTFPNGERKLCVVIEPKTRDSVVIRNRCLKRSEKSSD